ncbi:MAG: integrase, partial [Flavobacteriaceae bacterium CG_4_8_14_3_um_filter_34_10]
MRTKNTFSISFWADLKNAKNDKALIYARVTVNSKRVNISLKRKVYIYDWDSKKSKAKGTSPHARQTNLYLDQVHARLFQIFQDFKFKGEFITAQLVKAAYNGEANSDKTLLNIFSYHEIKIENTLAVGTIRNFEVSTRYVLRYLNDVLKTSDLYLKQLDYKFISD